MKKRVILLLALLLPAIAGAGVYDDMLSALRADDTPGAVALLDRGVDVNTTDRDGNTLLMLAIRENNAALLEQLIKRRARLNLRNRDGDTALRMASFKGSLPFVRRLVEAGAEVNMFGWSPLSYAAYNGHAEIVDYLLQHGASANAQTENGSSALMLAARNGHQAVAEVLLKHKANPNLVSENGETAIDLAVKHNNTAIAELLRAAGGHAATSAVIEKR